MDQFKIDLGDVDDIIDEFLELRSHFCKEFELIKDLGNVEGSEVYIVYCPICGNIYKEIVETDHGGTSTIRIRPGEEYDRIKFRLVEAISYGGDREGKYDILDVLERLREATVHAEHANTRDDLDAEDMEKLAKTVLKHYLDAPVPPPIPTFIGPAPCRPRFKRRGPMSTGLQLDINGPPPIEGPGSQHGDISDTDKGRFWVFAGEEYYPAGGMNDLKSTHDTMEAAKRAAVRQIEKYNTSGIAWCHIYDSKNDSITKWDYDQWT
jgi:hypothetical protein